MVIHLLEDASEHSPVVVVANWKGLDPKLPVVVLNFHYNVVPADTTAWAAPPFEAIRKDGKIYGRGHRI
jgi:aminoacylase